MYDRVTGTVKWFNNARGYGFIKRSDHDEDIFVHYKEIRGGGFRSLNAGQRVEFTIQTGEKGIQAKDVAGA
ncbi:cold shock domain-containing protein [Proteobacteria bacterium 005FR1]|nr:cold shock domain-containing protein [Proteobacteria bacterium 005FR1]